jgi:hypothetical protein
MQAAGDVQRLLLGLLQVGGPDTPHNMDIKLQICKYIESENTVTCILMISALILARF